MRYMLESDACVALIKRKPEAAIRRISGLEPGDAGISSLTLAELRRGAAQSASAESDAAALEEFLLPLEIADFGTAAAETYGRVRAELEAAGTPIAAEAARIGAHALNLNAVLVAPDVALYGHIPGLQVEDWTGPIPAAAPARAARQVPPAPTAHPTRHAPPSRPENVGGNEGPLDPSLL
ncbi:MAG: type II toxin-antitoxin system VapC family toxin [Acidobacteriota bacterium]|nr:type II toxin-antitoxin system VapC family toxin [Acidobacteriota bacterium]